MTMTFDQLTVSRVVSGKKCVETPWEFHLVKIYEYITRSLADTQPQCVERVWNQISFSSRRRTQRILINGNLAHNLT